MHTIGALTWVVVAAVMIILSMLRNAGRTGDEAEPSAATPMARPTAPPAPQRGGGVLTRMYNAAPEPPVDLGPKRAVTVSGARSAPVTPPKAERPAGVWGAMFEDRTNLMRAVVAAEVLGPPAALREHTFWSPRHSEPST